MKLHLPKKIMMALLAAATISTLTPVYAVSDSYNCTEYNQVEHSNVDGNVSINIGIGEYSDFDMYNRITNAKNAERDDGIIIGGSSSYPVNRDGRQNETVKSVSITLNGGTNIGYIVGIGLRSSTVTGDVKIKVNSGSVGTIIGGVYNFSKFEALNNDGKSTWAPKSPNNNIDITIDGGSVRQIICGNHSADDKISAAFTSSETDKPWAIGGNVSVTINGGTVGTGSVESGYAICSSTSHAIDGMVNISVTGGQVNGSVYAGGMDNYSSVGGTCIAISGGNINGNVYAGGNINQNKYGNVGGTAPEIQGNTSLTVSSGVIEGSVYGGGIGDNVKGKSEIVISGGTIKKDVYAGGVGEGSIGESTSVTISGEAKVEGIVHGGGTDGYKIGKDRILNLGTEEEAYNGSVDAADFSEINANNGDVTIASYTTSSDENNSLTLNVRDKANLTIVGDMLADVININGGGINVVDGALQSSKIILGKMSYKVWSPGFVGADGKNGFKQDDGREAVGLDNGIEADSVTDEDGVAYYYDDALGKYIAPGDTHWHTYYINTGDHTATVSDVRATSDSQLEQMDMQNGTLIADESVTVKATGGKIALTGQDVELTGELSGETALDVTGTGSISGDNSHTGDTIITGLAAKLTVGSEKALGDSAVYLREHGTLDLGGFALTNSIHVEGCTISGASQYNGDMTVSGDLLLTDDITRAAWVTLSESGSIKGNTLETRGFELQGGNRTIETNLTVLDGGAIVLHSGNALTITGNLTIGKDVCITLVDGGYAEGDRLLTWTGTLTGNVADMVLDAEGGFLLEQDGKTIKLTLPQPPEEDKPIVDPGEDEEDNPIVGPGEDEEDNPIVGPGEPSTPLPPAVPELPDPEFDQATADVLVQSNWGIFTASRAFTEAVQGQRNNMGCIAGGRGTAWASLLGGMTDISGSGVASGSDITLFGAAVGVDMKLGKRSSLGVAFGYTDGEASADGLGDIDQETGHIALYGEHGLKKFTDNSCLSLDWVAATGTTESKYMGTKWEQDSVQFNARLSWNKQVTERFSYNVFGGLEYFASESDCVQNCKSGSVQNLRGKLGAGVRYVAVGGSRRITDGKSGMVTSAPGCERVVFYGEVSYINDMVRNNPSIEVHGLRGSGANPGRRGAGVKAGANIRIGERWSANANYSFNAMDDSDEHILNIGASRTF